MTHINGEAQAVGPVYVAPPHCLYCATEIPEDKVVVAVEVVEANVLLDALEAVEEAVVLLVVLLEDTDDDAEAVVVSWKILCAETLAT